LRTSCKLRFRLLGPHPLLQPQSSQSQDSYELQRQKSAVPDFICHLLSGHDSSASSRRRSSEAPRPGSNEIRGVASLQNQPPSQQPSNLEKTIKALEAERARSAKLEAEKSVLQAENAKLIKASTSLAKENSIFRQQLQLESEDEIVQELLALHNRIRCWCQKFYDTTARYRSIPELPRLPSTPHDVSFALVNADKFRVQFNIAAVWEHHLDYVFEDLSNGDDGEPRDNPRDLWTTRENAKAIDQPESTLQGLSKLSNFLTSDPNPDFPARYERHYPMAQPDRASNFPSRPHKPFRSDRVHRPNPR
jgi:hypothetical protein